MNTWLYLTPEGLADPSSDWPCCLSTSSAERPLMALAEAAKILTGQAVHVLLPMEMCSWLRTEPWPSRARPGAQAIAFAIEDQLSEDLEDLHLSVGQRDQQGCYPVLVIHKQRFRTLLALFADGGIEVASIHVDADRLPTDQAYAVWWCGRWLLGGALHARLALPAQARATLEPLLPADLCWRDKDPQGLADGTLLWGATGTSIDLLHGEFRQVRHPWPWRTALLSGLALFALAWGFNEARSGYFEGEAQRLYAQSEQRFRTLYPEQTRIVDLSAQLKALQSQGKVSQDTQIARLLKLTEQVIGASSVEVQRIEYRMGDGWKLQLTAGSFAELEQLRERGQNSALPIRLGSASKVQNRVQALLTLEDRS